MRDVIQDVQPGDILRLQQFRRIRIGLLQNGGQNVSEPNLVLPGALDVQHRGLQDPLERQRLVRFPAPRGAGKLLERAEKLVQRMAQGG